MGYSAALDGKAHPAASNMKNNCLIMGIDFYKSVIRMILIMSHVILQASEIATFEQRQTNAVFEPNCSVPAIRCRRLT